MLITTLRSTPCGRSGLAKGSSPVGDAVGPVGEHVDALAGPSRPKVSAMLVIAWPDCMRRSQASREFLNVAELGQSFGIVRTPLEPSAWQDWQEFLTVSIQACWVLMTSGMPLPLSPVPGNWFAAGICSSEYQYMPG